MARVRLPRLNPASLTGLAEASAVRRQAEALNLAGLVGARASVEAGVDGTGI